MFCFDFNCKYLHEFLIAEDVFVHRFRTKEKCIAVICHHSIHKTERLEHYEVWGHEDKVG